MINEAKNQWNRGALVHLMYHACPPDQLEACSWDNVQRQLSDAQWNELTTDGTNLNNVWKSRLDIIAVFLQDLKDNGVEVLWRPLHEMNKPMNQQFKNNFPFWWTGRPGATGSRRLYQITHDYMVKTKGLTNLVWVWDIQDFSDPSGLRQDLIDYNPGDSYWDIAALDFYGGNYSDDSYRAMVAVAGTKPIAIGECDVLPTAEKLATQPRWTFFMAWAELVECNHGVTNTPRQIADLYHAANVVTLDDMPGWS
jgi:mannan endo-1,4-beta-mannosidase